MAAAIDAPLSGKLLENNITATINSAMLAIKYPTAEHGIRKKLTDPGSSQTNVTHATTLVVMIAGQNSHLSDDADEPHRL